MRQPADIFCELVYDPVAHCAVTAAECDDAPGGGNTGGGLAEAARRHQGDHRSMEPRGWAAGLRGTRTRRRRQVAHGGLEGLAPRLRHRRLQRGIVRRAAAPPRGRGAGPGGGGGPFCGRCACNCGCCKVGDRKTLRPRETYQEGKSVNNGPVALHSRENKTEPHGPRRSGKAWRRQVARWHGGLEGLALRRRTPRHRRLPTAARDRQAGGRAAWAGGGAGRRHRRGEAGTLLRPLHRLVIQKSSGSPGRRHCQLFFVAC